MTYMLEVSVCSQRGVCWRDKSGDEGKQEYYDWVEQLEDGQERKELARDACFES